MLGMRVSIYHHPLLYAIEIYQRAERTDIKVEARLCITKEAANDEMTLVPLVCDITYGKSTSLHCLKSNRSKSQLAARVA